MGYNLPKIKKLGQHLKELSITWTNTLSIKDIKIISLKKVTGHNGLDMTGQRAYIKNMGAINSKIEVLKKNMVK